MISQITAVLRTWTIGTTQQKGIVEITRKKSTLHWWQIKVTHFIEKIIIFESKRLKCF
jgi:hypothetical protein